MNVLAPIVAEDQVTRSEMSPEAERWAGLPERVDETVSKLWRNPEHQGTYERTLCALVRLLLPKVGIEEMFDHVSARSEKLQLPDVLHAAATFGLIAHEMPVKFGKIEPRLKSCIFLQKATRFGKEPNPIIVLDIVEDGSARSIVYYDTVSGTVEVADSKSSIFRAKGTAYFLRKQNADGQATSTFQRKATKYSWFRALLTRFNKEFLCTVVLSLFANVLTLATPLFIMLVYDRVISVKAVDVLPMLIVAIFGISTRLVVTAILSSVATMLAFASQAGGDFSYEATVRRSVLGLPRRRTG